MEASALYRRGWSISAIARHLGRDRKTIRAYVRGERQPGVRRVAVADVFARFEGYVRERLSEDPHVWGSVLFGEVVALGYPRSYVTFVREIRRRGLRPRCEACQGVTGRETIEIPHPAGEEIQWDWLELPDAPWGGDVHMLVGVLSHSGRVRAVLCDGEDHGHLVWGIDQVLRRLGGTARRWRTDRMATVCDPGSGRVRREFAEVARYYGVGVDVCPPRRANRKGVVEAACRYLAQRFWRTLSATSMADAQHQLDGFCVGVADQRRRGGVSVADTAAGEVLQGLPALAYPALIVVERVVSRSCLVAYGGNRYSVPAGLHGQRVTVRRRVGDRHIEIVAATGMVVASHRLHVPGGGVICRHPDHHAVLEHAVLGAFTTERPCRRKVNRPPGQAPLAAAAELTGSNQVVVSLDTYNQYAQVTR